MKKFIIAFGLALCTFNLEAANPNDRTSVEYWQLIENMSTTLDVLGCDETQHDFLAGSFGRASVEKGITVEQFNVIVTKLRDVSDGDCHNFTTRLKIVMALL